MLSVELIETEDALRALSADWQSLARRVPGCLFSQTFDWCIAGWTHLSKNDDVLKCLAVRSGTELVGIWPFYQRRTKGIRQLDLLGSSLGDYADPLIDPAHDSSDLCVRMLETLSGHGDVLDLNFLATGSNMQIAVAQFKGIRKRWLFEDFTIDPRSEPSWDAFMSRYSKNMRHHLRSSRRKLDACGDLRFELATDAQSQLEIIDWTMQQKQRWLQRNNLRNDWYYEKASRAFLANLAHKPQSGQHLALFALKLDGEIVATDICGVGGEEITGFIVTFDPAYSNFSPGMLLVQDVAHWAFDRDLSFGLMVNRALEKERWANRVMEREAYQLALTPLGVVFMVPGSISASALWLRKTFVGKGLKAILSPSKIKHLKALFGRLKKPAASEQT